MCIRDSSIYILYYNSGAEMGEDIRNEDPHTRSIVAWLGDDHQGPTVCHIPYFERNPLQGAAVKHGHDVLMNRTSYS